MSNKQRSLQQAVLKTLIYSDLFDYPLTEKEVHKFLISSKTYSLDLIKESLKKLNKDRLVGVSKGFWFCSNKNNLPALREKRSKISKEKVQKADKWVGFFKYIPWIKMVCLTGALAMRNAEVEDDIDLLIVTSEQRLWTTRLLVVFMLKIFGDYRGGAKCVKDKICPNLWLTAESLEFPDKNLFTAHEVAQAVPVFDRNNTYQQFLQANSWVNEYLANFSFSTKALDPAEKNTSISFKPFIVFKLLFDFLDNLAYRAQKKYMSSKINNEKVEKNLAAFHPGKRSSKLLNEYLTRCKESI